MTTLAFILLNNLSLTLCQAEGSYEKYRASCRSLLLTNVAFSSGSELLPLFKSLIRSNPVDIHSNKLFLLRRFDPQNFSQPIQSERWSWKKYALRPDTERREVFQLKVQPYSQITIQPTWYEYSPEPRDETVFHVNFADPVLFRFWKTGLFAQDEVQVAEHPLLGLWQNQLLNREPDLVYLNTQIQEVAVISGIERYGKINTFGIYGNDFQTASQEILKRQSLPQFLGRTRILALAAKPVDKEQGQRYTLEDIQFHLLTATTGFLAARIESLGTRLTIHTGHWGTGAFGNNAVLIAMIQIFSAHLAHIDQLVYNAGSDEKSVKIAANLVHAFFERAGDPSLKEFFYYLDSLAFVYGRSNGS